MAATETLGKYSIVATLGRGGMGEVFLAKLSGPAGFNKLVVVKAMRDTVAGDERFKKMLLDEARLAARLQHPNVVQTIEVGDVEGRPLIAMEYLEGQPLNSILNTLKDRDESLGVGLAARIVSEALSGLHYAHELEDFDGKPLGIVHRDISPHNIFVTYEGEVKILDFGIAKATSNVNETETGTVKGKVAYMAPEQARGTPPLDRRADLFAIGLVLWETLTTRRLLEGDTTAAILAQLLYEALPPVTDFCPDLDPALVAIVARSIEKDVGKRFQTGLEMRQALAPFSRDVEREALGRRVGELFEKERRELQVKIRGAMRSPRVDEGSTKTIRVATGDIIPHQDSATLVEGAGEKTTTKSFDTPPPSALTSTDATRKKRSMLPWVAGAVVCAGIAGGWFATHRDGAQSTVVPPGSGSAAATPAPIDVVLRLQGADTLGDDLAPALVEAFFRHEGATSVTKEPDASHHRLRLVATFPIAPISRAIDITSGGNAIAFASLASGESDVGMSSRRPRADEVAHLKETGVGDPTSPASEHVVALDGVAIITSSSNVVRALGKDQLVRLFSGSTIDWVGAGGAWGPVNVYVRDESSGDTDAVRNFLGLPAFLASAKSFADNASISDAVAADQGSVGFVGMAYVRNARAVAISAPGIPARAPTQVTVATESYLLSRRLYLYTAERPKSALPADFARFAISPEGQKAVHAAGFVSLGASIEPTPACGAECPARYVSATRVARRVSIDFRFRDDSTELDNRSAVDVDRVVALLDENKNARLMLLGFSDASAGAAAATSDSMDLAKAVRALLNDRGARVSSIDGFGSAMPIVPPGVEGARARNRRVEVWLDDGTAPKIADTNGTAPSTATTKPPEIETTR